MNTITDHMLGDDYSYDEWMRRLRLDRIDKIFAAMKAQGRIPMTARIDTPEERAAFHNMIEPLYAQHYEKFRGNYPQQDRNGRDKSDLYFAALTDHMISHGFEPRSSAYFQNDTPEAFKAGETYREHGWGRQTVYSAPSDEWLMEPRHNYTGIKGESLLHNVRMAGYNEASGGANYEYHHT